MMTTEEQILAEEALKEALAAYMRAHHGDDTIQLVGAVVQISGSGVERGEVLSHFGAGSSTEVLGLLRFADYHVENKIFGLEDDE